MSEEDSVFTQNIGEKYQVSFDSQIQSLSNEFMQAFHAGYKASSGNKKIYAMVGKRVFPPRIAALEYFKNYPNDNLQTVVDYGKILKPDGKEAFVIILELIEMQTLAEYILTHGAMDERGLVHPVISQLISLQKSFDTSNLTHGSINPSNIYFDPLKGRVIVAECFSSPCGYSQQPSYEALNQLLTMPIAKGAYDPERDYFALGAVILYMLSGQPAYGVMGVEDVLHRRLEHGSCDDAIKRLIVERDIMITKRSEIILKGLLTDLTSARWGMKELSLWMIKKDPTIPPSKVHRDAANPFIFHGKDYYSLKMLSDAIAKDWDEAIKNLDLDELSRWIMLSAKQADLGDAVAKIIPYDHAEDKPIPSQVLTRLINIIDHEGPIRTKSLSINVHGIAPLLASAYVEENQEIIQQIAVLFRDGLVENWILQQEQQDLYTYTRLGWNNSRIRRNLRITGMGFGMERVLYDLNSNTPCMSSILNGKVAITGGDALVALEEVAKSKKEYDSDILDRHITAFLGNKINISDEISIKTLKSFPSINRHTQLQQLALLTVVQVEYGPKALPYLSEWMYERLQVIFDKFRSKYILKEVQINLKKAVKKASLVEMYKVISSPLSIKRDVFGFNEARNQYAALGNRVAVLKNHVLLQQRSYVLGLRISVMIGYMVLVITIVYVMYQSVT